MCLLHSGGRGELSHALLAPLCKISQRIMKREFLFKFDSDTMELLNFTAVLQRTGWGERGCVGAGPRLSLTSIHT